MKYINLPDNTTHRLSFYLAMEEFVAKNICCDDCFFMWQVKPSVIFGRNQLIESEVNTEYCKANGISMFRRKSGGGCVYADMSNIMFSYITTETNVNFTFNRYIGMVVAALRKMNVKAVPSGRNDILIDGKKVSGNAFYSIPGHSIVHGTMLYDTDMRNMTGAITPSDEKLISKGVESVRQRITLLKDHTDMTLGEFMIFMRQHLCDESITLTHEDVERIKEIEKEYLTDDFIYGKNPRYSLSRKKRIEGVGDIEIRMEVKNNIIKKVNMLGDFFIAGDIDNGILKHLRDTPLNMKSITEALPEDIESHIPHLKKDILARLIAGETDSETRNPGKQTNKTAE